MFRSLFALSDIKRNFFTWRRGGQDPLMGGKKSNLDQQFSTCRTQILRLTLLDRKAAGKSNLSFVVCGIHPAALTSLLQEQLGKDEYP